MQPKRRAQREKPNNRDLIDRPCARRTPRAMTLVELMLVLMLLTIIGSLAAPLVDGSFASVRLQRGTDQVLAAWARARTTSIESGQIYQFRFQPQGSLYRIQPWQLSEVATPTPDTETPEEPSIEDELTETLVFVSGRRIVEQVDDERQVEVLTETQTDQWSAPILFFPDGTTSPASILLRNERNIYQRATLRALTGVGRSSELLNRDEANRAQSR